MHKYYFRAWKSCKAAAQTFDIKMEQWCKQTTRLCFQWNLHHNDPIIRYQPPPSIYAILCLFNLKILIYNHKATIRQVHSEVIVLFNTFYTYMVQKAIFFWFCSEMSFSGLNQGYSHVKTWDVLPNTVKLVCFCGKIAKKMVLFW